MRGELKNLQEFENFKCLIRKLVLKRGRKSKIFRSHENNTMKHSRKMLMIRSLLERIRSRIGGAPLYKIALDHDSVIIVEFFKLNHNDTYVIRSCLDFRKFTNFLRQEGIPISVLIRPHPKITYYRKREDVDV